MNAKKKKKNYKNFSHNNNYQKSVILIRSNHVLTYFENIYFKLGTIKNYEYYNFLVNNFNLLKVV